MYPSTEPSRNPEYLTLFDNDRPLFGVSNTRDRVINVIVGLVASLFVVITFLCGVAHPPVTGINVYFVFCILLICGSHLLLIYWYRQGDIDPKFRILIYYNAFTLFLLCICALCNIFVKK